MRVMGLSCRVSPHVLLFLMIFDLFVIIDLIVAFISTLLFSAIISVVDDDAKQHASESLIF
jgi:hypothetical protein